MVRTAMIALVGITLWAPAVGMPADWNSLSPTLPLSRQQTPVLGTATTYSISPDGTRLAVVFREKPKTIWLHSLESERPPVSFEFAKSRKVDLVQFNFDGNRLAVVSDGDLELLGFDGRQLSHDKTLCSSSATKQAPASIGWSKNNQRVFLVRAGKYPEVEIYDVPSSKAVCSLTLPDAAMSPILNSDGSVFLAFHDESASLWRDGQDGTDQIPGEAKKIVVSASGNRLAIVKQKEVRVWSLLPLTKGDKIEGDDFRDAKLSSDGKTLLVNDDYDRTTYSIDDDGRIKLGNRLEAMSPPALSRNGKYVANMKNNRNVRDICVSQACGPGSKSHPLLRSTFTGWEPDFRLNATRISDDATRILNYWRDFKILEAIDANSGIQVWAERVPPLRNIVMSPSGKRCVSIDEQEHLRIHRIDSMPKIESINLLDAGKDWPFGTRLPHLQFLGDSRQLLAASRAGQTRFTLIDAESATKTWQVDAQKDLRWTRVRLSGDHRAICVADQNTFSVVDRGGNVFKGRETPANPKRWHASDLPVFADFKHYTSNPRPFFVDPKTGGAISYTSWDTIKPSSAHGVSMDGRMYAAAGSLRGRDGDGIEIRSVLTGKKLASFPIAAEDYSRLSFTRDKTAILLGSRERLQRLPLATHAPETILTHDYDESAAMSHADKSASARAAVPLPPASWETKPFNSIACSAVGWAATGNDKGYLNIWSMHDGLRYAALRVGVGRISVVISQDGRYVAFARNEGEASILDLQSILPIHPPVKSQPDSFVSNLSF